MPDYKKSKIYKIVNDVNDNFYIGSTVCRLSDRMSKHRAIHDCMSKNLGVDLKECKIILIEAFECENKQELFKKEREYFDKYKLECNDTFVNKVKPIISKEEYKEYHKEYIINNKEKLKEQKRLYNIKTKELRKQYCIDNKEKIKERQKQYRIYNKDKIKQYKIDNKEKNKQYCIDNKEKIKETLKQRYINNKDKIKEISKQYRINNKYKVKEISKKYRINNKDKIKQYKSIKCTCECGSTYCKTDKARHNRTKKHIKYLATLI
tara:strand:+ start:63 stop:854 length:792 start_codon:yes stop_codon:yes gene_type:complete